MRIKTILCSTVLVSLFITASSFEAPLVNSKIQGEWFKLGDKNVGFGVDHDVINFGNWRDDVRQIKLKVKSGPLKMYKMKIHFDNGTFQVVELRNRFAQGSESRIIDLDGGLRHLTQIEFWYETKGFAKGRSEVEVWGRN